MNGRLQRAQLYIFFKGLVYCLQNCQFKGELLADTYCIIIDEVETLFHMCNLRYYDCHSGQDTQMLYVLVKLDEVTSLLSNPREISFRLYSFCHELRLLLFTV